MCAAKSNNSGIDYQKEYDRLASEFWTLQQINQTEEEKKYESLCKELETMAKDYRKEIDDLAEQNKELNKKYGEITELKKKIKYLEEKEQVYLSVLSTF